jgi:hypothetical protein
MENHEQSQVAAVQQAAPENEKHKSHSKPAVEDSEDAVPSKHISFSFLVAGEDFFEVPIRSALLWVQVKRQMVSACL